MSQAKGVLPTRAEDRDVLYANPRTCGYFIGVRFAAISSEQLHAWLDAANAAINRLVARIPLPGAEKGEKIASVAIGYAPRFFDLLNAGTVTVEVPVGLRGESAPPPAGWFPNITIHPADVLLYVASTRETRVNEFIACLGMPSVVESITLDRAYQRSDETEVFGYKDGLRNVEKSRRSQVVFVHSDAGQPDEPDWADGGTYMVSMRIVQNPGAFQALPSDDVRDAVMGRAKDGTRLDLVGQGIKPHDETTVCAESVPGNAHVRKAGPRGAHDDTEIFRRGMPFMDVINGQLQVGLHFCSFQANPAQFDAVFNDWMMNQRFPTRADGTPPGVDALMTAGPAGPLTQVLHAGLYFVPPHHPDGLNAALAAASRKPTHGRLAITKRVVDPSDPSARFERGGFTFHVQDDTGAVLSNSAFTTLSSGRGACPAELEIGKTYTLVETGMPSGLPITPVTQSFLVDRPNVHLVVTNQIIQPGGGYGVR